MGNECSHPHCSKPLILVTCATGKTGNIGGFVALSLASTGKFRIRIGARNLDKARERFEKAIPDASYVRLDLSDPSTFANAVEGVDRIFLGHPESGFEARELQQAFMETVGSIKPHPPYVVKFIAAFEPRFLAKMATDTPILHYGLKNNYDVITNYKEIHGSHHVCVVEARSWFFQNYIAEFKEMVKMGCIMSGSGDALLPRIDSRDIADAVVACLQNQHLHGGKVITLTGPTQYRESEVAAMISKEAGRTVVYSPDPSPLRPMFESIKIDKDLTMWNVMCDLWNLERMTESMQEPLQPKVFQRLTGRKFRTLESFLKENRHEWAADVMGKAIAA